MKPIISLLLATLVGSPVIGQELVVTVDHTFLQVTNVDAVYQFGPTGKKILLIKRSDGQNKGERPVAIVRITNSKPMGDLSFTVTTTTTEREELPFIQDAESADGSRSFALITPGTQWVDVTDWDNHKQKKLTITVGPPTDPDPDDPDDPPDPDKPFDDIAGRCAVWTANATRYGEVASAYKTGAAKLRVASPIPDMNRIAKEVTDKVNKVNMETGGQYNQFSAGVMADLTGRWGPTGMPPIELAQYYDEIAKGVTR